MSRSLKYDSNFFFDHRHIYIYIWTPCAVDHFTPLALRVRGNKDIFEDLSRNASGFEKTGQQQCSGKIKELGWIIGRLNTVQEKPVEVGRNGRFLKPWMLL